MAYKVVLSKKASKDFAVYSTKLQEKVITILESISENPYIGKNLKGPDRNLYSFRVNLKDRIVYEIHEEEVIVYVLRVKTHYGD